MTILFRYKPGDAIIFYSDALYHSILPWVPDAMTSEDSLTPGRVSYVYTTHQNTVEVLERTDYKDLIVTGSGHCDA